MKKKKISLRKLGLNKDIVTMLNAGSVKGGATDSCGGGYLRRCLLRLWNMSAADQSGSL